MENKLCGGIFKWSDLSDDAYREMLIILGCKEFGFKHQWTIGGHVKGVLNYDEHGVLRCVRCGREKKKCK